MGDYNVSNVLMVIVVVCYVGVVLELVCEVLGLFVNIKCCLELKGEINGVMVYDDFVYYLMVIEFMFGGLCNKVGDKKIIVVFELCFVIMKLGVYKEILVVLLYSVDLVYFY